MQEQTISIISNQDDFTKIYPPIDEYCQKNLLDSTICRIFLVRHGQSAANLANVIARRDEPTPLTEKGKEQSRKTGNILNNSCKKISAFYSSPAQRAKETAETIRQVMKNDLPIKEIPDLIEKSFGDLEGRSNKEYNTYKEEEKLARANLDFEGKMNFKFNGRLGSLESLAEVKLRATTALTEIAKIHLGQEVIATAHNALMKTLLVSDAYYNKASELDYRIFEIENCSIYVIESDGLTTNIKAVAGAHFVNPTHS